MMTRRLMVLVCGLALTGLGCSDDDSKSDGSVSDASGDVGASDGTTPDAGLAKLSGIVVQFTLSADIPLEGAKVSILDASPPVEATTDADGVFELDAPDPGVVFLLVEKTDLLSSLRGVIAVSGGIGGIELGLVHPDMADAILADLSFPARDPAKGLVSVEFSYDSGDPVGGETADIDVANDGSFVFDKDGDPQSGASLIEDGDSSVIFANVATGTTAVTITGDNDKCSPNLGTAQTYPVRADTLTTVDILCTP